jgi:hypothetical protein
MIPTKRVAEVAGTPHTQLAEWVGKGVFTPTILGGKGRGNSHRFDFMTALGVVVACMVHQSPRGCCMEFMGEIAEAFTHTPRVDLLKKFGEGRVAFVMVHTPPNHPTEVILQPLEFDWVDVQTLYWELVAAERWNVDAGAVEASSVK